MNHYHFDDIGLGQTVNFEYELTAEKMEMFKKITGQSPRAYKVNSLSIEKGGIAK